MSIFSRFFRKAAVQNSTPSSDVRVGDQLWDAFVGNNSTNAPSEQQVLAVTAVSACVTLVSGAIAALPMHIYKRDADFDLSRDYSSPLWWILNEEFCPRWPAASGWAFLTASKLLHGDGFAEILRTPNGKIKGLVPIHPYRIRVIVTPDGGRLLYEVWPDASINMPTDTKTRIIDQDDMLHIPGFGFNGVRGLSALKNSLRVAGRLAINAQDFSSNFLKNMARPDFALTTDQVLKDDQYDRLKKNLDDRKGSDGAGKPMILDGGLSFQSITMPLEEMQLLETRKFQVEEIARAFGVQPFMIGHTEKTSSWGTGIEAMGAGFVRYTLRDHLNTFQNEINRKFFRQAGTCAEFDTTELERADTAAMFAAVRIALGRAGEPAFMTLEEGRQLLRLPREMVGTVPDNSAAPVAPAAEPTKGNPAK